MAAARGGGPGASVPGGRSGRTAWAYGSPVPEQAEPPSPRQPGGPSPAVPTAATAPSGPSARRTDAVLFDFQGTLAQVEDAVSWVRAAAADCGAKLTAGAATLLADRLVTAGRAG